MKCSCCSYFTQHDSLPFHQTQRYGGGGDPNGPDWHPAESDTTLQLGDHWFYNPSYGYRDFAELKEVDATGHIIPKVQIFKSMQFLFNIYIYIYIYKKLYIYIYIYMCKCVCV